MIISNTLKNTLSQLLDGKSVAASSLRADMAGALLSEGLLTVSAHGSRRCYKAIDTVGLKAFLQTHYEELHNIGDKEMKPYKTRYGQAAETGNSKLVKIRSCPGFPVNSYVPVKCRLCGRKTVVCPPEGSFMFIADWQQFTVPDDVVVIGIENMENFRLIRLQRLLFESVLGDVPLLFVSRYPQSVDLRSWLQNIPNRYVHFGDFDLAGVNIYLTEFKRYLEDRASLFVPSDIEERLRNGTQKRYDDQYQRFCDLRSEDREVQTLIDLINKYHRGYDQEGYIKSR